MDTIVLILSDARGIYIPRDFVCNDWNEIDNITCEAWGIKIKDAEILQNPDNEWYWNTWSDVLNYAQFNHNGDIYRLMQDGDLWGYCLEKMTNEEKKNFGFDVDEDETEI